MKLNVILFTLALVILSACTKNNPADPNDPGNTSGSGSSSDRPKKISIRYYTGPSLSHYISYTPDYTEDSDRFVVEVVDSFYFPDIIFLNQSKLTVITNEFTGTINQVISQNLSQDKPYAPNNAGFSIVLLGKNAKNLRADFFPVKSLWARDEYNSDVHLDQFEDSLQQVPFGHAQFLLELGTFNDMPYYRLKVANNSRQDFYQSYKDSTCFEDQTANAAAFMPRRYSKYFERETPWYRPYLNNRAVYYTKTPFVCDSFKLRNGFYEPVAINQFLWEEVFRPQFERKVTYKHRTDTAGLGRIISIINPGSIDASWYYIAFYLNNTVMGEEVEGDDISDMYDLMSESSTDSVFTTINNVRAFKQAEAFQNKLERDSKGRISKITRRRSKNSNYKVIEIEY